MFLLLCWWLFSSRATTCNEICSQSGITHTHTLLQKYTQSISFLHGETNSIRVWMWCAVVRVADWSSEARYVQVHQVFLLIHWAEMLHQSSSFAWLLRPTVLWRVSVSSLIHSWFIVMVLRFTRRRSHKLVWHLLCLICAISLFFCLWSNSGIPVLIIKAWNKLFWVLFLCIYCTKKAKQHRSNVVAAFKSHFCTTGPI